MGDTLALYRLPRDEQIRRLALRAGPWSDDEMQAPTVWRG